MLRCRLGGLGSSGCVGWFCIHIHGPAIRRWRLQVPTRAIPLANRLLCQVFALGHRSELLSSHLKDTPTRIHVVVSLSYL